MTKIAVEKQNLRRAMREKLRAQSASQIAAASREIQVRLKEIAITSSVVTSSAVALFLAQAHEPNLDAYARHLLESGTRVFVPHARNDKTFFSEIAPDWSNVTGNAHGWREAGEYSHSATGARFENENLSAIFLPGLAFDLQGHRLGQGGGWYDRALAGLGPGVLRVGICFDFQVVDSITFEAHDQNVELIVTERRTIGI